MDKRTFLLTNKYSVVFSADSPDEAGHRLFGPVVSGGLGRGVLLRNGGRLDLDVVSRPEYATPECGTAADLVVYDKAGERILEGLLEDARRRPRDEGVTGDIRVLKINPDPAESSFGCQEDYLVSRGGEFGRLADILIPFLVTRQLICGPGAVGRTPRGTMYCLSRPGGRTGNGLRSGITRSRPLINVREDARGAAAGWRRLRVIVSDPAMSETTTLLKAGATDLVLRMARTRAAAPDLPLDNPVLALGEVSGDITGRSPLRLARGGRMSALDIQREYLARAKDFTDRAGADAVDGRVLSLWERALEAIGAGNLDAAAREIDWVIKYQLIERYRAVHDLPLSAPSVAQADLAYHDIHRPDGLYYRLERGGAVDRAARDIDIFEAKTVPPAPGRYRQAG